MAVGEVVPISITAQQGPTTRPYIFTEVEELMRWTMTFANGFVCDCTTSYANPRPRNDFRAQGPKGWIKINNAYRNQTDQGYCAYRLAGTQT
jgi:hypothetical protein